MYRYGKWEHSGPYGGEGTFFYLIEKKNCLGLWREWERYKTEEKMMAIISEFKRCDKICIPL